MDQQTRNSIILKKYIPEAAVSLIAYWVVYFDFKLKIKKGRETIHGDYRPPLPGKNHQITINNNLNPYSFLVTLVHEIAHLSAWKQHKEKIKPHGDEWKTEFRKLMTPFLNESVFPEAVLVELKRHMQDPAATSCTDVRLSRVLKSFNNNGKCILEELPELATFVVKNDRHFVKLSKVRKRYLCKEVATHREYLFDPLTEVRPLE